MTITSYGYGQQTVNEAEWARLTGLAGSPYSYSSPGACAPYVESGLTLGFQNGSTFGWGVLDDFASHKHTLPATPSWWCVALRRSWGQLGRKSEIVALPTASVGVPPSRAAQPGRQDDQPLAFVQTSSSTITAMLDARQHASKNYYVRDLRVVHDPQLGATYTLPDGTMYDTTVSAAGTTALKRRDDPADQPVVQWKPPAWGVSGLITFEPNGAYTLRHNLGYKPAFFHVQWVVNEASVPLVIRQAQPSQYPDAITTTTVKLFAKYADTRAPYPGNLSSLTWVAYGGY